MVSIVIDPFDTVVFNNVPLRSSNGSTVLYQIKVQCPGVAARNGLSQEQFNSSKVIQEFQKMFQPSGVFGYSLVGNSVIHRQGANVNNEIEKGMVKLRNLLKEVFPAPNDNNYSNHFDDAPIHIPPAVQQALNRSHTPVNPVVSDISDVDTDDDNDGFSNMTEYDPDDTEIDEEPARIRREILRRDETYSKLFKLMDNEPSNYLGNIKYSDLMRATAAQKYPYQYINDFGDLASAPDRTGPLRSWLIKLTQVARNNLFNVPRFKDKNLNSLAAQETISRIAPTGIPINPLIHHIAQQIKAPPPAQNTPTTPSTAHDHKKRKKKKARSKR